MTREMRLQQFLDGLINDEPTVRNGLLFVSSPEFTWKGASGYADPDTQMEMHADDQFVIDSIGKMMTATLIMMLVEEKQLALDDAIGRYLSPEVLDDLKDFAGRPFGETVTIRQLLGHRSGLADDWNTPGFLDLILENPERHWTPKEAIEFVKLNTKPAFSPGEGFLYSDPGFNMLGLAIESITGLPLHVTSRERLLAPLGMKYTYRPSQESPILSSLNRGASKRYLEDTECTLWPAVVSASWAGGESVSTAEDLNRFFRALIEGDLFKDSATLDMMIQWKRSSDLTDYGLGLSRVNYERRNQPGDEDLKEVWGHAGSSHNFMYYWPSRDLILIATLNQLATQSSIYDTAARILNLLLELER